MVCIYVHYVHMYIHTISRASNTSSSLPSSTSARGRPDKESLPPFTKTGRPLLPEMLRLHIFTISSHVRTGELSNTTGSSPGLLTRENNAWVFNSGRFQKPLYPIDQPSTRAVGCFVAGVSQQRVGDATTERDNRYRLSLLVKANNGQSRRLAVWVACAGDAQRM